MFHYMDYCKILNTGTLPGTGTRTKSKNHARSFHFLPYRCYIPNFVKTGHVGLVKMSTHVAIYGTTEADRCQPIAIIKSTEGLRSPKNK